MLFLNLVSIQKVNAQTNTLYDLPTLDEIRPYDNQLSVTQLIEALPESADINDPLLTLVNRSNLLEYEPYVPFVYSENGIPYHEALYTPLAQLREAAALEGYYYNFISGYRTIEQQAINRESRYYSYINDGYSEAEAQYQTDLFVAPSNGSEHTTGLAVDLLGVEFGYELMVSYQYEPSAQWLADNAYQYGFVLRYLDGKTDITNINFEPWHLRYVGVENATYLYQHGLVLEEYLALIQERDNRIAKINADSE